MSEIPGSEQGKVEFTGGLANIEAAFAAKYETPEGGAEAPIEQLETLEQDVETPVEEPGVEARSTTGREHQERRAEAAREQIEQLAPPAEAPAGEGEATGLDAEAERANVNQISELVDVMGRLSDEDTTGELPQAIYDMVVAYEDLMIDQYKGVPPSAERDAEIRADVEDYWTGLIQPTIARAREASEAQNGPVIRHEVDPAPVPTVAEAAPASPEAAVERSFSPEQIAVLSRSSVEIYTSTNMTNEERATYRTAAAEKGIKVAGDDLDDGHSGWQVITERPEHKAAFRATANAGIDRTAEILQFRDVAEGYPQGSEDDPNVNVQYAVKIKGGGSMFAEDAVGYSYSDRTGRPGNLLNVSFDVPRSAAEFMAAQAESDPEMVRKMVEAVVLETGMPPKLWGEKEFNSNALRPNYVSPKEGYRIGVSGGAKVGVEDYEQKP